MKKTKSVRKTVNKIPRGGFQSNPGWVRKGADAAWRQARKHTESAFRKTARQHGFDLDRISTTLKGAKLPTAGQARKVIAGTIYSVASEAISGAAKGGEVPFVQSDSTKIRSLGTNTHTAKRYITRFASGRPSTRGVKQLARQYGTTKSVIQDTIRDSAYNSGTAERNHLTQNTGFNQKFVGIPVMNLWTATDLHSALGLSAGYVDIADKLQKNYICTKKLCRQLTIMNTGTFLKANVKIKLYRQLSSLKTPASVFATSFFGPQELADDIQLTGMIPKKYQLKGRVNEGEGGFSKVNIDPIASMTSAPEWATNYDLVRTFSKTLEPGDIWEFNEELHCGAGINMETLHQQKVSNPNSTLGYVMAVEFMGPKVLGCYAAISDENFIGTAPCYMQFESKIWHESVNAPNNTTQYFDTTSGGIIPNRYAIRSFAERTINPNKVFNVSVQDIVTNPNESAQGKLFIPITSDTVLSYAQRVREGGTGGDD